MQFLFGIILNIDFVVYSGHCILFNKPIHPNLLRPIRRDPDQALYDVQQELENT